MGACDGLLGSTPHPGWPCLAGLVVASDQTDTLTRGYWPSFNVGPCLRWSCMGAAGGPRLNAAACRAHCALVTLHAAFFCSSSQNTRSRTTARCTTHPATRRLWRSRRNVARCTPRRQVCMAAARPHPGLWLPCCAASLLQAIMQDACVPSCCLAPRLQWLAHPTSWRRGRRFSATTCTLCRHALGQLGNVGVHQPAALCCLTPNAPAVLLSCGVLRPPSQDLASLQDLLRSNNWPLEPVGRDGAVAA